MLILSVLVGLNMSAQDTPPAFENEFRAGYDRALEFVSGHRRELETELSCMGEDPGILIPVVFPELVRYSLIYDKAQTFALQVFYVNLGEDYADFSIGPFQMKPSFASRIERELAARKLPGSETMSGFRAGNESAVRSERVARLQDLEWQIRYLAAFSRLVRELHADTVSTLSGADLVRFLASAYNAGFLYDPDTIRRINDEPGFPYGRGKPGSRYRYADVSVAYFENRRTNTDP